MSSHFQRQIRMGEACFAPARLESADDLCPDR